MVTRRNRVPPGAVGQAASTPPCNQPDFCGKQGSARVDDAKQRSAETAAVSSDAEEQRERR